MIVKKVTRVKFEGLDKKKQKKKTFVLIYRNVVGGNNTQDNEDSSLHVTFPHAYDTAACEWILYQVH